MVAVSDARGGADSLVLDDIVIHASPELMNVMRGKYDPTQSDYLRHTECLAQWDWKSSQCKSTRYPSREPASGVEMSGTCSGTVA